MNLNFLINPITFTTVLAEAKKLNPFSDDVNALYKYMAANKTIVDSSQIKEVRVTAFEKLAKAEELLKIFLFKN